ENICARRAWAGDTGHDETAAGSPDDRGGRARFAANAGELAHRTGSGGDDSSVWWGVGSLLMAEILLLPPVAFLFYLGLVSILSLVGRVLAGTEHPSSEAKSSAYASG